MRDKHGEGGRAAPVRYARAYILDGEQMGASGQTHSTEAKIMEWHDCVVGRLSPRCT